MKRYEPLRFFAGRKSTLALLCKQQQPRPSSETNRCLPFLPRDALQCKARYCDRMSSVRPSV